VLFREQVRRLFAAVPEKRAQRLIVERSADRERAEELGVAGG
jgi:hypothetical protein